MITTTKPIDSMSMPELKTTHALLARWLEAEKDSAKRVEIRARLEEIATTLRRRKRR